jgi:hypothetical protein
MTSADERLWHDSLKAPDSGAANDGGLAVIQLVPKTSLGKKIDGHAHYQKVGRMHLIPPLASHQASNFCFR